MEENAFMQLYILFSCMCLPISCVTTTLHEPVTLTCNKSCHGSRKWTVNDDELVIKCQDHDNCRVGNRFEKRVRMSNDSLDLIINEVEFNDQGSYVCTCGDHDVQPCYRTLKVLVPQNLTASPGEDVTLHCYAATNITFVLWEKDGEIVLQYKKSQLTRNPMMENRASISEDRFKNGDLSLHLSKVRKSDKGLYHCYYSEFGETDKFKGASNSVRLEVQAAEKTLTWTWRDIVLGLVLVVSGAIGAGLLLKKYLRPHPCTTGARLLTPGATDHEVAAAADQDSVEPGHTSITVPVPESDDHQLSIPLMETSAHSSHPWKEESIHGNEIP